VIDQRSNSLVVTTRPSRMTQIRSIIERLDRGTEQVMIESKFVEVTEGKIRNIGVNWSSLSGYQVGVGKINQTFDRTRGQTTGASNDVRNSNDAKTTTSATNGLTSTVSNSQTSGSSNSNSLTSTNGTPTATANTTITGGLTGTTTNGSTSGSNNDVSGITSQTLTNLISLANTGGTARNLSAVFSASEFSVVLSALSQLQDTKVVSNPTIVTLNNNAATINVGEERPIPSYTYSQERGTYEVSGFTYRPIGIILKVTPQVNAAGTIRLSVDPEVSQSTRDATFQGAAIPIVETRKVSTTVVLKDGYTMGIGGLLRSAANDSSSKIPVLGSLPLVGRLFSSKSLNQESTNLIIFITAKTISPDGAPVEQIFDSERVRDLKLRRSDLPGYRDGSDPFIKEPAPPTAQRSDSK
jgi:type IV pilus assembly protein PilQ